MRLETLSRGAFALPPARSGPPSRDRPDAGKAVSTTVRTRILIVEDEALVAMDMEESLGASGFDIVGIVDTQTGAIEAAGRLEADVVLMDITLRQGNGIAAAQALAGNSKALIIFVSANADPKTLAAAQALNPAGFIGKPFVARELPTLVADVLARAGRPPG